MNIKTRNGEPIMAIPGMNVEEIVVKTIEETVKKLVSQRIDKLILTVIHHSDTLGIFCPHRDDNMIRLTHDAKKLIREEINRSFNQEVMLQVAEMSDNLKATIKQRVDENMSLFEVGNGNWVFRTMGEQIQKDVAKMLALFVKGLTIQANPNAGNGQEVK